MASAAREYRYAHREFSTNGNLARDLDWAVRERELEHAGRMPRHEEQAHHGGVAAPEEKSAALAEYG